MRKCYEPKRTKWLEAFVRDLSGAIQRKAPDMPSASLGSFDLVFVALLQEVMADGWSPGIRGGRYCALALLEDNLMCGRCAVVSRLKLAARCGILKGLTARRARGRKCLPLEIQLNPAVKAAYDALEPGGKWKGIIHVLAEMFVERRAYPGDVQGFETICQWGEQDEQDAVVTGIEPQDVRPEEASCELLAARNWRDEIRKASEGTRDADKRRAQKEKREWQSLGRRFVDACAKVWSTFQARQGFGNLPPIWQGDYAKLSAPAKQNYRGLVQVFETYGGRTAALAWALFCGSKTEYDDNGKIKFLPQSAHKQWTTPDKKPEHFVKHIQLIIRELTARRWFDEADYTERLRPYFEDLLDVAPKSFNQQHTTTTAPKEDQRDDAYANTVQQDQAAVPAAAPGGGDGVPF